MNSLVASIFSFAQPRLLAVVLVSLASAVAAQTKTPSTEGATKPVVLAHSPTGAVVTTADVFAEMERASEASRKAFLAKPANVEQLVNNLLMRRSLAKEAERDGLANTTVMAAALQIARDRVLSDARLARLDAQNEPSLPAIDAEARKVYDYSQAKFEQPAQTRASHILLTNTGPDSLVKAKALLAQLRSGASFAELAKTNSTDAGSAARGGDLGFFGAGQMVRPFEEALNNLKNPGDLSEPVESQFGYHIIKLEERRDASVKPFVDVKAQLAAEARANLLNQARLQKATNLNNDFVFDTPAFEAFLKTLGVAK
jgi:peptidyl-prolyl cis-trans isomerase C